MHEPVLLPETLSRLSVSPTGRYVDATYGRGGHSRAILDGLGPEGRLWVLDCDPQACDHARRTVGRDPRVEVWEDAFVNLPDRLREVLPPRSLDGLLLDLGVSSAQIDAAERGFSFRQDGPLDMRMSAHGQTAAQWLATVPEDELVRVLSEYGEERHSRRIARAVVAARQDAPLTTTRQLARIVEKAAPAHGARLHPATRTFQAIRILINRELAQLESLLGATPALLAAGGRLVVISFHSLEDRIVKRFLHSRARPPAVSRHFPEPSFRPDFELYSLVRPAPAEIERNSRARSARLRTAGRLA